MICTGSRPIIEPVFASPDLARRIDRAEGRLCANALTGASCDIGVVMTQPRNRIEYQWNTDAGGTVTSLKQHLDQGQGAGKTEITANYDKAKNQTAIDLVLRSGPAKLTAPGLVTLRTSTISGGLSFSDGIRTWPQ